MVAQGEQQVCCQPTTANSSMLSLTLTSMQNFLNSDGDEDSVSADGDRDSDDD